MVLKVLSRFERDDRMYYFGSWVVIKNFVKHQSSGPKIKAGIKNELKNVPDEILDKIRGIDTLSIPYDDLSDTNTNTNINSNTNSKNHSLSPVDKPNNESTNKKTNNEPTNNEITNMQFAKLKYCLEAINDLKSLKTWCEVIKQISFKKTIEILEQVSKSNSARKKAACAIGLAKKAGYSFEKSNLTNKSAESFKEIAEQKYPNL